MKEENIIVGEPIIPPQAIRFVAIKPELSGCGRYSAGSWDIVYNSHTQNKIRVTVETKYIYNNRQYIDTDGYNLDPQTSFNLGCDFWRGDFSLQEFDRKIVKAIYL